MWTQGRGVLQLQYTCGDGVSRHAAQKADFGATGLSGEVGEEDETGGEGPIVHGFIKR